MKVQHEISSEWSIKSVKSRFGHEVKFWDDGFGPLYVYRDSMGVAGVVRAESWEEAFECVTDEILTPIPESEVCEAYGFASDAEMAAARNPKPADGWSIEDTPHLIEGYRYQGNSTGTGIVAWDLNGEALDVLTPRLARELELKIRWERERR